MTLSGVNDVMTLETYAPGAGESKSMKPVAAGYSWVGESANAVAHFAGSLWGLPVNLGLRLQALRSSRASHASGL